MKEVHGIAHNIASNMSNIIIIFPRNFLCYDSWRREGIPYTGQVASFSKYFRKACFYNSWLSKFPVCYDCVLCFDSTEICLQQFFFKFHEAVVWPIEETQKVWSTVSVKYFIKVGLYALHNHAVTDTNLSGIHWQLQAKFCSA